jgi:hypothetical protein
MATKKSTVPQLPDKPAEGMVRLYSKDVGHQDFTEAHAKALLDYQEGKGYTHWGRVPESAAESA